MANYTIEIKADNIVEDGTTPIAGTNKESDTTKSGLLSKEQAKAFSKGLVAYHGVKSFATQVHNHYVSMVELRTGSKELQQRASFYNDIAQKGIGILESVVAGALVGGLGGAVVGLAVSTTHTLVGLAQAQDRINTQQALENETIFMNTIRAGTRGSRSSE